MTARSHTRTAKNVKKRARGRELARERRFALRDAKNARQPQWVT